MPKRKRGGQPGHPKHGGRKAGMPNRATIIKAEAMAAWVEMRPLSPEEIDTITPLEALLYILRVRLAGHEWHHAAQVAAMAAPYTHAKLTAIDMRVHADLSSKSDLELQQELDQLDRLIGARTIVGEAPIEVLPDP
jgi:hypothetical protein